MQDPYNKERICRLFFFFLFHSAHKRKKVKTCHKYFRIMATTTRIQSTHHRFFQRNKTHHSYEEAAYFTLYCFLYSDK